MKLHFLKGKIRHKADAKENTPKQMINQTNTTNNKKQEQATKIG